MNSFTGKSVEKEELAEIFGVSVRTIGNWIKDGCPVARRGTSKANPSLFDTADIHEWQVRKRLAAVTTNEDGKSYDYEMERARLTHFQAREKELSVHQQQGDLIPAPLVRELCITMYAGVKAKILAIEPKVKARNSDISESILADISDELRTALLDVADDGLPPALRTRLGGYRESDASTGEIDLE